MFKPIVRIEDTIALGMKDAALAATALPGKSRRLPRYKVVNGRKFQLHATRGWKCIGRVSS